MTFALPQGVGYAVVAMGERAGSATAVQLADVDGQFFFVGALPTNAGNVYLGNSVAVTVPAGTTDITSGLALEPGETVLLPIHNLSQLWIICDNAGDDLSYLVLA